MKRKWYSGLDFYLVAPIVLACIIGAFWLSGSAIYENYRFVKAVDQIAEVVDLIRYLRIQPIHTAKQSHDDFFKRMAEKDVSQIGQTDTDPPETGLITPWGRPMRLVFYPNYNIVQLITSVSPVACRRLLLNYAEEVDQLGLRQVDVKTDNPVALWRRIYEEKKASGANAIPASAVYSGCDASASNSIALTFYLNCQKHESKTDAGQKCQN